MVSQPEGFATRRPPSHWTGSGKRFFHVCDVQYFFDHIVQSGAELRENFSLHSHNFVASKFRCSSGLGCRPIIERSSTDHIA